MQHDLKNIFSKFAIDGQFVEASPYGSGHINDTYAVICNENTAKKRYIIQRINHNIFKNPPQLMDNIVRVTRHIFNKLEPITTKDEIYRNVLTVIPTHNGSDYHKDADGNYWRAYYFVENAKTYDVITNIDQAYQSAKAFGNFQSMLTDLPQPPLFDTIPDFHNGPKRFKTFQQAVETDICNRAKDAKKEIDFVLANRRIFETVPELIEQGKLPLRITHNDTKINNVMIDDNTGRGICVIDLDTVMPGSALYDFGDIMRTTISRSEEDERDLSKVFVQMSWFEAILKGYLESASIFLNKTEKEHLVFGGKLITFIIGTRFLTDFLSGDVYFKVHRDGHNLDRCRTQFKLVASIMSNEHEMSKLVEKHIKSSHE
jgi:thiamine kinase-like enzyme